MNNIKNILLSLVAPIVFVSLAAATLKSSNKSNNWAVGNHRGTDIWLISPDGVAHAIPPACRRQAAVWRQGDKGVEPPIGALKWPVITEAGNLKPALRGKAEFVTIGDEDNSRRVDLRHFTVAK